MAATFFASEGLHARSAGNTIQAQRSVVQKDADGSVVTGERTRYRHLGEMRQLNVMAF